VNPRDPQPFRKRIATVVAILLVAHALLCIYFIVTPRHYILHHSPLGLLYHRVFLIGPFFTEKRIASSTDLYMRYKVKGGSWSELSCYTDRVHREGGSVLFHYNDLKHDNLLRYFANAYRPAKTTREKSNAQLCLLNRYSIYELIPKEQPIDSINLLYIQNTFLLKDIAGTPDTLWNITLNPDRCVVR
jgi:hypothetical protein